VSFRDGLRRVPGGMRSSGTRILVEAPPPKRKKQKIASWAKIQVSRCTRRLTRPPMTKKHQTQQMLPSLPRFLPFSPQPVSLLSSPPSAPTSLGAPCGPPVGEDRVNKALDERGLSSPRREKGADEQTGPACSAPQRTNHSGALSARLETMDASWCCGQAEIDWVEADGGLRAFTRGARVPPPPQRL